MFVKALVFVALLSVAFGEPNPVKTGYGPGDQDWGWIKVRTGANMFYWLYYTTAKVPSYYERPLVIWLQGGPGGSSTGFGNFAEIGPLHVNGSARQYAWTKQVNVLFIDNPVGTGFSYVENSIYLTKNNVQIGADMMAFLTEFYNKYPDFKKSPLYFFSESYGGKMAVEMVKQLDERIKAGKMVVPLKGVVLIDSWISPIDSVLTWAPLLVNTGLIDQRSYRRLQAGANNIQQLIKNEQWDRATAMWGKLEIDIMEETHGIDFYNIMSTIKFRKNGEHTTPIQELKKNHVELVDQEEITRIMNGPVRKALNIPNNIIHGGQRNMVFDALRVDFMKPVMHVVEHLLNNTNVEVIVMSGQLDLIVDTYGTLIWVDNLRWKGKNVWDKAIRAPFLLGDRIEGFVTKANALTFYWVNRAGHMVPMDAPEPSMEILRRVTKFDGSPASDM